MDQETARASEATGSSTPRRLLRKGTHSCSECKRRKTRCFFDNLSSAICVGCQRRGTRCVGQEFIDIAASKPEQDPKTVERLERIEQMLAKLTEKFLATDLRDEFDVSQGELPVSKASAEERSTRDDWQDIGDTNHEDSIHHAVTGIALRTADNTTVSSQYTLPEFANACQILHAALPSQHDVNLLFGSGRAAIYLQALCYSYRELFEEGNSVSAAMLSILPAVTAHPVVLARKLLQLALCIQQLDPSFNHASLRLGMSAGEAMHKYYSLASSKVTCHDDLLDSLEGLECLIYEGVYLVNCGNLRRALVTLRRAATLAQFMGMHRKVTHTTTRQHDPATRVSGDVAWAHIAYLERYISLLLGMSSSITNAKFGSDEKKVDETDAEWFERFQVDICELIINNNRRGNHDDLAATQKIDETMNRIADSISSNWWAPLELRPGMTGDDLMALVVNAQMQIVHYNLLTVLHLPYLLRKTPSHQYDYNKTVCTYASREVLNRYIAFRSIVRIVFCCRIVDFCALTASLTLLLAHLSRDGRDSTWLLKHQRLGDRALVEKTIETLDELNRLNGDELTRETAKLARQLMVLEADSAKTGEAYKFGVVDEAQDNNDNGQVERSFYLKVPYFGTVKMAPQDSFISPSLEAAPSTTQTDSSHTTSSAISSGLTSYTSSEEPIQLPQHVLIGDESSLVQQTELDMFDIPMPDLMADTSDWAFQGVDTAFFDSLMSCQMMDEGGWNSTWYDGQGNGI
ncbi:hypothetical protein CDV31_001602 [Fusarium ambrosium]|uniref:Zn(2)-C6 fungal-type domain-containing protein n=1 Tax=Fusarium ambrosium TaxID=131363 RepID=A0A428UYV3_9HYPO|nr:hypothetical protein CDV31_001602 [Fusarium ambrosium]